MPWMGSPAIAAALRSGTATASAVAQRALNAARTQEHGPIWTSLVDETALQERTRALDRLDTGERGALALFGLPFAVKDNIDVNGMTTTAACPAFAYSPTRSAAAVELLERAGAVCIGKTNLDQFATGLVGTRSPYGVLPNPFDATRISGGSSSGSAVAVALGQVAFALGTDTAGSGRVPAGFTNTLGIKPTRGLVSTRGVVAACRSLDCVSIFASALDVGWRVLQAAAGFDSEDAYSRHVASRPRPAVSEPLRLGVFEPLQFAGDSRAEAAFARAAAALRDIGAQMQSVPYAPFGQAAALLYDGARLAERDAAFGAFVATHPGDCDPVVRDIVAGAGAFSATDAYRAEYRLREIAREVEPVWSDIDALVVPTAPNFPSLADIQASPRAANSMLGTYTNFANLLDMAAIALPAGFRDDGLPSGITLLGPAGSDHLLALIAHRFLRTHPHTLGVSGITADAGAPPEPLPDARPRVRIAVAGAHMRGMPLNHELERRDARFVSAALTAPRYRLYALPGALPKPGLVRAGAGEGNAIAVEVWDVPCEYFGGFVEAIPPPMAMGNVELGDGTWVKGFVCEPIALNGATEITYHGDWRNYIVARGAAALSS